jgi:hypothetical protein
MQSTTKDNIALEFRVLSNQSINLGALRGRCIFIAKNC